MKKFGFGLIGCGAIARCHANAISDIENAKLVAVYDFNYEFGKKFAEEHNCKVYRTLDELLSNSEIDIVNICTPSGLHFEQIIASAKAKKNVIVEKPIVITEEQMQKVIEAVEENNIKVEVISQLRFTYSIKTLKDAIDAGKLGKIYLADYRMKWYRTPEYYAQAGWRGTWAMDGGGALMNQGIHGIDLIQYLMGGIKSVYADCRTLKHDIEVEDSANILVEYNNGAIGVIQATTAAKPGYNRKIEVHAEKGTVILSDDTIELWDIEDMEKPQLGVSMANSGSVAMDFSNEYHRLQFIDLIDAIANDRKPLVDVYEGKKPVEIILAAYKSNKEKTKIEL